MVGSENLKDWDHWLYKLAHGVILPRPSASGHQGKRETVRDARRYSDVVKGKSVVPE